jgi:hypothetical protein
MPMMAELQRSDWAEAGVAVAANKNIEAKATGIRCLSMGLHRSVGCREIMSWPRGLDRGLGQLSKTAAYRISFSSLLLAFTGFSWH